MDTIVKDLRYAARKLLKAPGFTLIAVGTLALGIGANTAIFTVFDRALLSPLPVENPDELVILETLRQGGRRNANFSYPAVQDYRENGRALSGVLGFSPRPFTMTTATSAERVDAEAVTVNYFDVLGVGAARGRTFAANDATSPVAVISHAFWQRRFGGDPGIVGRTITLNGQPTTVVGIAPEAFRGLQRGVSRDVWVPAGAAAAFGLPEAFLSQRNIRWLYVAGRLAPGVTPPQAQAALSSLFEQLDARNPSGELGIAIEPGARGYAWMLADYSRPLTVLMAFVGLVLLIACANVANLLLARGRARRGEVAIRLSLGASRGRLIRQFLAESALLGVLGAAVGAVLATWGANALARFGPSTGEALLLDVSPDARVLGFTLALTAFAVLASGLAPAWRASRPDVAPALKGTASTDAPAARRRFGLQGGLVAGQIALSLVILVGAGLLLQSLRNLRSVDVGYDARDVLTASFDVGGAGYDPERARTFYDRLIERVEALPGVESASLASTVTPSPAGSNMGGLVLEGYETAPDETIAFDLNQVSPGHFETIQMPILSGRGFTANDRADASRAVVVDRRIVERYWPNADPIGKRIRFGTAPTAPEATVVGVAKAGRYRSVREDDGMMLYAPLAQLYSPRVALLVRAAGDPLALAESVRRTVRGLEPSLPLYDVTTLRTHVDQVLATDRMVAALSLVFGVLALVLAALGVYGVMAHLVARRTREVGIRMALGARRADVLRLMLARSGTVLLAGLVLGGVGALAGGRLLAGRLYGVSSFEPWTLAAVAALLGAVSLLASWLPARRATRVDPIRSLRTE